MNDFLAERLARSMSPATGDVLRVRSPKDQERIENDDQAPSQRSEHLTLPIISTALESVSNISSLAAQLAAQRQAPRVVKLELILTEACNLGCSYCFEYDADHQKSMPSSMALEAVDFLMEASRTSPWVGITFMGGEPMLQFDHYSRSNRLRTTSRQEEGQNCFVRHADQRCVDQRRACASFFRDVGLRYCLSLDGAQLTNDRYRKTSRR